MRGESNYSCMRLTLSDPRSMTCEGKTCGTTFIPSLSRAVGFLLLALHAIHSPEHGFNGESIQVHDLCAIEPGQKDFHGCPMIMQGLWQRQMSSFYNVSKRALQQFTQVVGIFGNTRKIWDWSRKRSQDLSGSGLKSMNCFQVRQVVLLQCINVILGL